MVDHAQINDILGELNKNPKVITSLVISRSGMHIAGQPSEKTHSETFVTMAAILLSAAETAISEFKGELEDVYMDSDESRIIINRAGNKGLLVVLTNTKDDQDPLHSQIKETTMNLETVL